MWGTHGMRVFYHESPYGQGAFLLPPALYRQPDNPNKASSACGIQGLAA